MTPVDIAQVVHEANRALQAVQEDPAPSLEWHDISPEEALSAISGVEKVLAGTFDPKALHEEWCRYKVKDGWVWGEEKSYAAKTHPCLIEYESLPPAQRIKDKLFIAIVQALDNGERKG